MAHYDVTFLCGHTEVKELFGKVSERERKIKWFEESCVCSECYKNQQRDNENAKYADVKDPEIKEWFEKKLASELGLGSKYYLRLYCILKESDKAVYALLYTGYNADGTTAKHRTAWIPKSAIVNLDKIERIENYDKALEMFDTEYRM